MQVVGSALSHQASCVQSTSVWQWQPSVPCYCRMTFCHEDIQHFTHSPTNGHLGHAHFRAVVNICLQSFVWMDIVFSWGYTPRSGAAVGCMVTLCLTLQETARLFQSGPAFSVLLIIVTKLSVGVQISPHPQLLLQPFYLITAIPMGVRQHPTVVSSFEKYLFESFTNFFSWVSTLSLSNKNDLFQIQIHSQVCDLHGSSPSLWAVFSLS